MRALILIAGMFGVVGGAWAADPAQYESDALSGQFVYQLGFGGTRGAATPQSFQLQVANDWQRQAGLAPLRAEYRTDTHQFLVNGLDIGQTLVARQAEEGGVISALGGWVPMIIVLGAASLILIDGNKWAEDYQDSAGTGGF